MTPASRDATFEVRPYRAEDESRVLDFLETTFARWSTRLAIPPGRLPDFFRWKHLESHFGPSQMYVAEAGGQIIGFRASMWWRFAAGDQVLMAARGVDSATHSKYRRMGVHTRLVAETEEAIRGKTDLNFGTANDQSLPVSLKTGRQILGSLAVSIRILRPIRFAKGARSGWAAVETNQAGPEVNTETAAEALRDQESISRLLEQSRPPHSRLATPRDIDYLRWRYTPLLDYRAVREEQGGRLAGLAIFRVRPKGMLWGSVVTEVIVAPGDRRTARRLLRRVADSAAVDYVTCYFPPGSAPAQAAMQLAFLRWRGRITVVVHVRRDGISPDPTDLGSWALSLGDLEVM